MTIDEADGRVRDNQSGDDGPLKPWLITLSWWGRKNTNLVAISPSHTPLDSGDAFIPTYKLLCVPEEDA